MSALRLGRLPDGSRDIRILEPAVGRVSVSRLGIRGGGPPIVVGAHVTGESGRYHVPDKRQGAHSPKVRRVFVDTRATTVMKNPDNGGVQSSITEVQR